MPAGLEVKNDSGNTQIDSTYRNLVLRQKGTATATNTIGTGFAVRSVTVTFSGTSPIVGVRSVGDYVTLAAVSESGGTWSFVFWAPDNHSFTYYIFDVPAAPTSNFGLEVFNSSGQRVYWSGYPYLRVTQAFFGSDYVNVTGDQVVGPTSRQYAVVFARKSGEYERLYLADGTGDYEFEENRLNLYTQAISGGANFQERTSQARFEIVGSPGVSFVHDYPAYGLLLVDVTGY